MSHGSFRISRDFAPVCDTRHGSPEKWKGLWVSSDMLQHSLLPLSRNIRKHQLLKILSVLNIRSYNFAVQVHYLMYLLCSICSIYLNPMRSMFLSKLLMIFFV